MTAVTIAAAIALSPGGAAVASGADASGSAANRPNIVVVMTDDQDARSLRAMPKTRRLLGDRGTTFTQAYASFPLCCPSRATFLTGQHSHNHGVYSNTVEGGLLQLDDSNTLPVWLRDAGYFTAHVGRYLNGYGLPLGRAITLGEARREVPPGWNRWIGLSGRRAYRLYNYLLNQNGLLRRVGRKARHYQTDVLGRIASRLIRRQAGGGRPLFLSLATLAVHAELRPAKGEWDPPRPAPRHRGASKRKPNRLRWLPPASFNEADVSDKPDLVEKLPRFDAEQGARIRAVSRARWESLMAIDDAVAAIVRALAERGELANTIFIFSSDQGVILGEHRIPGGKRWLYEESARVPLIIRGPGIPAGARRGQMVSNVDLAPTILDAAGAEAGLAIDGISLLPLARDPDAARSRAILLESERDDLTYSGVRARGWAYLEHGPGAEELYDMRADRFQLESLHESPDHAGIKLALRGTLEALRDCEGTSGPAGCYRELALP
ncbi:MAG TPA: sulfatase [Solirubrobacterales bacterium]|nr:sulfatase [Solirubrobacterales bacterium]